MFFFLILKVFQITLITVVKAELENNNCIEDSLYVFGGEINCLFVAQPQNYKFDMYYWY